MSPHIRHNVEFTVPVLQKARGFVIICTLKKNLFILLPFAVNSG